MNYSSLTAKLLDLADGLQKKIDEKRGPMTQNWTAKRQREFESRQRDADRLEKTQLALRALARAHDRGDCPEILAKVKTKTAVDLVLGQLWAGRDDLISKWKRLGIQDDLQQNAARQALTDLVGGFEDIDAEREAREARGERDSRLRSSKRAGFFPTPEDLAKLVVELADIDPHHVTLEPSSGVGDLAKLVPGPVVCVELAPDLADITRENVPDAPVIVGDFEEIEPPGVPFDRVVMNPPFERGAALRHVRRAFEMLNAGGILAAVMPASQASKQLCEELGGTWYDQGSAFAGAAAFKSTSVRVGIAVIGKE